MIARRIFPRKDLRKKTNNKKNYGEKATSRAKTLPCCRHPAQSPQKKNNCDLCKCRTSNRPLGGDNAAHQSGREFCAPLIISCVLLVPRESRESLIKRRRQTNYYKAETSFETLLLPNGLSWRTCGGRRDPFTEQCV